MNEDKPAANTEPLNFRVDPEFKKRFKRCALEANLKLNELLKASLASWEREQAKKLEQTENDG